MIIRRKHNACYTIVPNIVLNDEALSYDAVGLLCYLLSKPDNWEVHVEQLRHRGGIGRDKARKLVNVLIDAGYIKRRKVRDPETNVFVCDEYIVFDEPQQSDVETPRAENPSQGPAPEKPAPGNQSHSNYCKGVSTESIKPLFPETDKTDQVFPSKPKRKRISYTSEFEAFWKSYPTTANMSKTVAFNEWQRLDAADQQAATASLPAYREHLAKEDWLKAVYAERYLKQRRFDGYADSANDVDWAKCCNAVIQSGQWSRMFGPLPGQPGCKVPPELVTPELLAAVQSRRITA